MPMFVLGQQLTAAGVLVIAISLFGLLIRQVGPWKRQVSDAEDHIRTDLIRRVGKLERRLETKEAIHKAERSLDRHRLNNVTNCFDALLLLLEMAPERASEAVQKIKAMRADQLRAEAEEKALIRTAEIAAAEVEKDIEEVEPGK